MQVQILVHIRPADTPDKPCFEFFECETGTGIRELKEKVRPLAMDCISYSRKSMR